MYFQHRQHEKELQTLLRDEFLIQFQKFLNQIGLTRRQLEGTMFNIVVTMILIDLFAMIDRQSTPRTACQFRCQ
jgi:hypothetical protein